MRSHIYIAIVASLLASGNANAQAFPSASGVPLPSTASRATTKVENILDPVEKPFQESVVGNCGGVGDCEFQFPATTHANTLILHVSCSFDVANGGSVLTTSLSGNGNNNINYVPISGSSVSGGTTVYVTNAQVYYFVGGVKKPQIDIYTTGAVATNVICTVAGYTD
jgi:hypothetical protein